MEELKKLLREMKENENTRKSAITEINAEMSRINLREETETERFIGTKDEDGNLRKEEGIYSDINAGLYNHVTEEQMQKIIDEELKKIKAKYDIQRVELSNKLDEIEKEKASDYKKISSAIKEYHLDMVLELNKANKLLVSLEAERNEKLKELNERIAKKEAERTHIIMKNRNLIDIESTDISVDIRALGQDIEELKSERDMLDKEYASRLKTQSNNVQHYIEMKDRASKFLGSIRLQDKSIDEIYELLFNKDIKQEKQEEKKQEEKKQEEKKQEEKKQEEKKQEEEKQEEKKEKEKQEEKKEEEKQEKQGEKKQEEENKKFSYEFSAKKGIKYDDTNIDINTLLLWYNEQKEDIENVVKEALGDKEDCERFLTYSDKLIYLSMIFKDATIANNGKITINDQTKQRLETYYNIFNNPESQEECDMEIKYDLTGMSKIQRYFHKSALTDEEVYNIKCNAYMLRNRKNVSIKKGLLTSIKYKSTDVIKNAKDFNEFLTSVKHKSMNMLKNVSDVKRIEAKTGETIENNSHEKFVDRLDPNNPEYTQTNDDADRTATTTVERAKDGR